MLALNIQTLFYKIGASNTEYKQKMTESKGKLQEFEQKTKDNIRTLRNWSLAAGAAAAGVVAGLNTLVKSTEQYAGYLEKLSIQTGVAVENMAALGYAAKQNESSLEELGSSMVRLTRRTQEASQGNQAYIKSYERMGVSFRDINGNIKSTDELLLSLADAFAESTDENLKTQVAFNLLGDSGYNLIPLLNQGRQGIVAFAEEANRLGIVLSRENIAKFGRYGEVMDKWKAGMNGVKMQLATAVVPVFTLLGEKANEGLETLMEWVRENPKLVAQGVVLGGVLTTLGLALGAVALGMTIVSKGAVLVRGMFGLLTNPILWLIALGFLLYTAWDENWGGIQEITQTVVGAIQGRIAEFEEWWENSPAAKVLKNLWAELKRIWENDETSLVEKIGQTLMAITKAFVIEIGGIAWSWLGRKYNSLVDWWNGYTEELFDDEGNLIGSKEHEGFKQKIAIFLDANLEENRLYQAIKKGLDGDWSDFWNVASDTWATGVVIAITLSNLVSGMGAVLSVIQSGLGLIPAAGASLGLPGLVGALTIGIQLMEAMSEGSYENFAKNILAAGLIAAFLYPVTGPGGALAGFNLALNLKIGEGAYDGFIVLFEWIGDSLQKLFSGRWGEFMTLNEFIVDRARKNFSAQVSAEYMENLLKAEEWVRERDPQATDWERHVKYTAEDWDVDENHLRELLGMELIQVPIEQVVEPVIPAPPEIPFEDQWTEWKRQRDEGSLSVFELEQRYREISRAERLYGGTTERGTTGKADEATESVRALNGELKTLDDLLNAIRHAEGGDEAEILYGMTSFRDRDVSYYSATDQARWEELSEGMVRDTDEFWRAAAQTTVESYWSHFQNKFPEVAGMHFDEVTPEMQQMFITYLGAWFSPPSAHELNSNWVPNVLNYLDFDELSVAFRSGFGNVLDSLEQAVYDKAADHETAADFLAKIYADRLVGQSPPPKGPLSDIDEGGYNTMVAWGEGAEQGLNDGIPLITRVLDNIKKLLSSLGDSAMNALREQFPELMAEFDGLFEKAELDFERLTELIEGITNGTDKVKETTKQWTDSLVQGLSNAIGYGRGLESTFNSVANVFDNFLGMIASQFLQTQVFAPLFSKIGFGDFLAGLPIFHDGGLVLSPAAYYHSGGYIGELKSDEVPIIAQTGERVLSRGQNAQFENLLQNMSAEGGGSQQIDVTINAVDAASFQELIRRNPDAIKHLIIDDVGRNGPLRKILLQLARS